MRDILSLKPYLKPYWKQAVLALVLLSSLVIADLSIPRLIERIIDQGIVPHNQQVVVQTALIMLCISAVSALIAIGNNYYSVLVGEGVARDLRESLFQKIESFSYGNLDRLNTGLLIVRLTSDMNAIKIAVQITLRIGTRAPLLMIGSLILMFTTSRELAIIMLPLLIVTSIIIVFFIIIMEPLFRSVQQKLDRLNNVLQENIAGVRLVKSFVRADYEEGRFGVTNTEYTDRSIRVMRFMATMSPLLTMCINVGMVIVIWSGGLRVIAGGMTVGQIVAFTNYLITTMVPLTLMTMLSNTWASGIVAIRRVNEIFEVAPEVSDAPDAQALPANAQGKLVFEDVSFHYNGASDVPVLTGINLVAEAGQTLAILGATGAGKSTLINLVPHFYEASTGRILIDGIDIRSIQQDSLLAHIGIVPQESILFSGTVGDNIRYGAPQASQADVVAAAKAAQAHDFVMQLPQQYDTHVEQRGANFSGGQKQRIAIARALLMRPKVLILDDSTSSVDVETETKIQDALQEMGGQCTSLVVAQRISTVLNADKIIVIDQGRVAAQGTHQELIRTSPIYQEIYDSQLGDGFHLEGELQASRQSEAGA